MICGITTSKGTPCQIPLRGGKCPTHDSDLSKRNKKVARSFKKHHPERFIAQRRLAGHCGFLATGASRGWERANEYARQYRVKHPSNPEQRVIDVLKENNLNHYEREFVTELGLTVDFGWTNRYAIEVEGHREGGFGSPEQRRAKQDAKVASLEQLGWTVLRYDPKDTLDRVVEFALVANSEVMREEEIPF